MTPEERFTVKEMLVDFRAEVRSRLDKIESSLASTARAEKVDAVVSRIETLEKADARESQPREIRKTIRDVVITALTSAAVAAFIINVRPPV